MLNKRLIGIVACVAITFSTMILGSNYLCAEQEETHKHLEKGLAPEHRTVEPFACPQCKEVRMSPEKGKTLAKMPMVCPDCKNEISELAVHHCDVCGKDVLVCDV